MSLRQRAVDGCARFIDDVLTAYGKLDDAEIELISNLTTDMEDPKPIDGQTEIAFGFRSTHNRRVIKDAEAEDTTGRVSVQGDGADTIRA